MRGFGGVGARPRMARASRSARLSKASRAAGYYSRNALRSALVRRVRNQIRFSCPRARTLVASAAGLSPAIARWLGAVRVPLSARKAVNPCWPRNVNAVGLGRRTSHATSISWISNVPRFERVVARRPRDAYLLPSAPQSDVVPKSPPWETRWRRDDTRSFRGGQGISFVATATDGSGRRAFIKTLQRRRDMRARARFRREAAAYETLAGLGPPLLIENNADS
jgi:hypothetical protein